MKLLEDGGAFPRRRNYLSTAKPLRRNVLGTPLHPVRRDYVYWCTQRKRMNERERKRQRERESERKKRASKEEDRGRKARVQRGWRKK